MELTKEQMREIIARRVAQEFRDGDVITLGIGLPTESANYIPADIHVMLQSENGIIGVGPLVESHCADERLINAGGHLITMKSGGCCFDSLMSFQMIRGGHVNITVLGGLQVDEQGNLANWLIPGHKVPGMGGAMDLVVGARKVIIAMEHTAKGQSKLVKKCTLPLTAVQVVDLIITEKGVIEITPQGFLLKEISPYSSLSDIVDSTDADLIIPDYLR